MKTAILELQKAIYDKIKPLGFPVHNSVKQGQTFPNIVIGEATAVSWNTKTGNGEEINFTLHVWSRQNASNEAIEITSKISEVMHDGLWSLTGFSVAGVERDMLEVFVDLDGTTRHGVMKYRIKVDQ